MDKKETEILNKIKELESFINDRISELHEVNGGQTQRHAFIFYRSKLWDIRDMLDGEEEPKQKKAEAIGIITDYMAGLDKTVISVQLNNYISRDKLIDKKVKLIIGE